MQRDDRVLGIRTATTRAEALSAGDVTLRGTYWYDLRARRPLGAAAKRFVDLAIAAPLLVLSAPLLLLRGVRRERRVGFRGHEFDVFVLRSGTLRNLPQLINVLRGSMSLVGPRAMFPDEVEHHDARRFTVRPGMTGLWRTSAGDERALDRSYINEWSLRQDLLILMRTARHRGASRR